MVFGRVSFPLAIFLLAAALLLPAAAQTEEQEPRSSFRSFSPFPILMYDTDIGFGYGGRVKFVDYLALRESFDLKAEYDRFLNYSFYGLGPNTVDIAWSKEGLNKS